MPCLFQLCLTNGETWKISQFHTIIFHFENFKNFTTSLFDIALRQVIITYFFTDLSHKECSLPLK